MRDVKSFVLNLYNKDGSFSFSNENKISNLYSTCFGVMCLDLLGELSSLELKEKEKIINFIQKYQEKKTGYFTDESCVPKKSAKHDLDYINLQLTDFAQMALSALNSKSKYEYRFLKIYKDEGYLNEWFYNKDWENPWRISNEIMFILNCLIYEDEFENSLYIEKIIDLLNHNQDPSNGFWNLGKKSTLYKQMAGAYHYLFFYTYLGLKPNYYNKIIDSTLLIQSYDGLFNYATGGGGCDDLDAVDLLCRSTFYTKYRGEEIKKALEKTYKSLKKNQNEDGGFCWAKRDRNLFKLLIGSANFRLFRVSRPDFKMNFLSKGDRIRQIFFRKDSIWKYSGLDSMMLSTSESDLFSTWFRLTSLAFIEKTFPEIYNNKESINWNLRTNCGLGFYKRDS